MPSVNQMDFYQLATILNSIQKQATGQSALTATTEAEFVSAAQVTLQAGYDPVMNAITQVLSRTIFSVRPYNAKFTGIEMDRQQWGSITRKLQVVDKDWENDVKFVLVDGQSIDHYEINKPEVLQTNFYGANVFEKSITIFTEQLDNAFSGSAQFGEFIGMVVQNMLDTIEQSKENLARATVGNFITGKYVGDSSNVIHLLTEYNAKTGLSLTATTVYQPANYAPFMRWVDSRIETLADMMSQRSIEFHINVTGKPIARHTEKRDLKVYMLAEALNEIKSNVYATTYNDSYLKLADVEPIAYWQSIQSPDSINAKPVYLNANGTLTEASTATALTKVFGVMFDREALGYTILKETVATTPLNAKGLYYNTFYHYTIRYFNDFTENGVVLLLD